MLTPGFCAVGLHECPNVLCRITVSLKRQTFEAVCLWNRYKAELTLDAIEQADRGGNVAVQVRPDAYHFNVHEDSPNLSGLHDEKRIVVTDLLVRGGVDGTHTVLVLARLLCFAGIDYPSVLGVVLRATLGRQLPGTFLERAAVAEIYLPLNRLHAAGTSPDDPPYRFSQANHGALGFGPCASHDSRYFDDHSLPFESPPF